MKKQTVLAFSGIAAMLLVILILANTAANIVDDFKNIGPMVDIGTTVTLKINNEEVMVTKWYAWDGVYVVRRKDLTTLNVSLEELNYVEEN